MPLFQPDGKPLGYFFYEILWSHPYRLLLGFYFVGDKDKLKDIARSIGYLNGRLKTPQFSASGVRPFSFLSTPRNSA